MAKQIALQFSKFSSDISNLNSVINRLEQQSKNTAAEIEALNAMWTGPAYTALIKELQKDKLLMEQYLAMLKNFQEELTYAKTTFTECETSVSEAIASFRI